MTCIQIHNKNLHEFKRILSPLSNCDVLILWYTLSHPHLLLKIRQNNKNILIKFNDCINVKFKTGLFSIEHIQVSLVKTKIEFKDEKKSLVIYCEDFFIYPNIKLPHYSHNAQLKLNPNSPNIENLNDLNFMKNFSKNKMAIWRYGDILTINHI